MIPPTKTLILLVTVVVLTALVAAAENDRQERLPARVDKVAMVLDGSPTRASYQGKPFSYWLKIIRHRDEDQMPLALDAIRYLGPDARAAVPELIEIVTAPFSPIRLDRDSDELILTKLYDIELRFDAVDALASIGEAASSATIPLIDWAVTPRVIPTGTHNPIDDKRFIDLVTMDVEKRIQIIIAIAEFGDAAVPAITRVLKSPDAERRKIAVAILGQEALTIAADLLTSGDCDDAQLGLTILSDMEPVVARTHLTELRNMLACHAN